MNNTKLKSGCKFFVKRVLPIFCAFAFGIGGAFAYLYATQSKTNTITAGSISITLNNANPGTKTVLPGESLTIAPTVTLKKGSSNSWIYLQVKVPVSASKTAVPGSSKGFDVTAYAIQDGYYNDASATSGINASAKTATTTKKNTSSTVWDEYNAQKSIVSGFGTATTDTTYEWFTLQALNTGTTGKTWTLLSTTKTKDYNYYIYGYNTMLNAETADAPTAALFTNAVMKTDIEMA